MFSAIAKVLLDQTMTCFSITNSDTRQSWIMGHQFNSGLKYTHTKQNLITRLPKTVLKHVSRVHSVYTKASCLFSI